MKRVLILSFLGALCFATYGNRPLTIKQVLEAPLPKVWANVREVYIWEGDKFSEYKIKKDSSGKNLTKFAKETAICNYLFDVEGNRTPYFVTYAFGSTWNIDMIDEDESQQSLDIFRIILYEEIIDDESGKEDIRIVGRVRGENSQKAAFYHYTTEIVKTFFGNQKDVKKYKITFNKDKTKVFLHLIS